MAKNESKEAILVTKNSLPVPGQILHKGVEYSVPDDVSRKVAEDLIANHRAVGITARTRPADRLGDGTTRSAE